MKTNKNKTSETMLSFRCSNGFAKWLDRAASRLKMPRSEYIRAALVNTNPQNLAFALVKEKPKKSYK